MTYNITEKETQSVIYDHFNGTHDEIPARSCVSDLCKDWPLYHDASEWTNYRSMFAEEGAKAWTCDRSQSSAWSSHWEMKATITQRFVVDDISIDVECDSQFIFWCLIEDGKWKAKYNRLFYEKDKVIAADGKNLPVIFTKDGLEKYPEEYRYLAVAQHKIGYAILEDLPTMMGRPFGKIYDAMAGWLRGEEVYLNWD
ncbi:hypothetical protein BOTCAL_0118g00050 [Botryotinia calthae]|uniref:SnoaL-like domain-containing protein n=1 Tax=Botryotinia calthae TaxID=38488 RepID=A0A4Y8D563_9HELO|nr:hypothetical protein BOTCAL_0118g00050 [Botryotinia calthae]